MLGRMITSPPPQKLFTFVKQFILKFEEFLKFEENWKKQKSVALTFSGGYLLENLQSINKVPKGLQNEQMKN